MLSGGGERGSGQVDLQDLFMQADSLLFKENKCEQAEKIYKQILKLQSGINQAPASNQKNERVIVDALNSIGYCIKYKASQSKFGQESPRDHLASADSNTTPIWELGEDYLSVEVLPKLRGIYEKALTFDPFDIEANFNLASVYMQCKNYEHALTHYKNCVRKDLLTTITTSGERLNSQYTEIKFIFKNQFQKAYFNIGVIHDRMGDIEEASMWYEKAVERGIGFNEPQPLTNFANVIDWGSVFVGERPSHCTIKAACNLSVCYEKLGNRESAMDILYGMKSKLTSQSNLKAEFAIYLEGLANNLGVIQRRNGQVKEAEDSYKFAISMQVYRNDDEKQQQTAEKQQLAAGSKDLLNNSFTSSPRKEYFYRMNLIRFFPIYNLAVSNAKTQKFDEAIQIFKDALQILQRIQNMQSLEAGPNTIYFVNVYQNMALVYEKKLMFQNALRCLNEACLHSQQQNPKLLAMRDRMQKIVLALQHKVITFDHFDKTFYREGEAEQDLNTETNFLQFSDGGQHYDESKKISLDKTIYQMENIEKEFLGSQNPMQSVNSRQSQPKNAATVINLNPHRSMKNSRHYINQIYSIKRQSKLDYEILEQSNFNESMKDEIRKRKQYMRKGNTTNLPEMRMREQNQLSGNKYLNHGTLSNDDCKTQKSLSKMRSVNDQLDNQRVGAKYHLMQSLEHSPEPSPLRDLSPYTAGSQKNKNHQYLANVQVKNLRPKKLHHYKGDPIELQHRMTSNPGGGPQDSLASSRRNTTNKSVHVRHGSSMDSRMKNNRITVDSPNKNQSKEPSINQSRDINLSIQDDRIIASSSSKRVFKVRSEPRLNKLNQQQSHHPAITHQQHHQDQKDIIIEQSTIDNQQQQQQPAERQTITEKDPTQEQTAYNTQNSKQTQQTLSTIEQQKVEAPAMAETTPMVEQSNQVSQMNTGKFEDKQPPLLQQEDSHQQEELNVNVLPAAIPPVKSAMESQIEKAPTVQEISQQKGTKIVPDPSQTATNTLHMPTKQPDDQFQNKVIVEEQENSLKTPEKRSNSQSFKEKQSPPVAKKEVTASQSPVRSQSQLNKSKSRNQGSSMDKQSRNNTQKDPKTERQVSKISKKSSSPTMVDKQIIKSKKSSTRSKKSSTINLKQSQDKISLKAEQQQPNISKHIENQDPQPQPQPKEPTQSKQVQEIQKQIKDPATAPNQNPKTNLQIEVPKKPKQLEQPKPQVQAPIETKQVQEQKSQLKEAPQLKQAAVSQPTEPMEPAKVKQAPASQPQPKESTKAKQAIASQPQTQPKESMKAKQALDSQPQPKEQKKSKQTPGQQSQKAKQIDEQAPKQKESSRKKTESVRQSKESSKSKQKPLDSLRQSKESTKTTKTKAIKETTVPQSKESVRKSTLNIVEDDKEPTQEELVEKEMIEEHFMKYNDAEKLIQEGQVEKAIENFNSILHKLRQSLSHQVAQKLRNSEIEIKKQELHKKTVFGVAELYYKSKNYDAGLQQIDQILVEQSHLLSEEQKFNFNLLKGKSLDMKGDYNQAVEVFGNNLKNYIAHIQKNQLNPLEMNQDIGNLEFRYGWSLIRSKKDVELGVQNLREANKKLPENIDIKLKLALILYQEQGKLQEAKEHLDAALKLNPKNQEVLNLYGKVFLKQKDYVCAEKMTQKAIDIQVKNKEKIKAGSFYHLGQSQELQQKYEQAISSFQASLMIDPQHFGSILHLGNLYQGKGDIEESFKYLKYALQLESNNIIAHYGLGKLYQENNWLEDQKYQDDPSAPKKSWSELAIYHFQQVLQKKSDHYKSLAQIGCIHLKLDQIDTAIDLLKKALDIKKDYAPALVGMGDMHFLKQEMEQALPFYKQARASEPYNIDALVGEANVLHSMKKLRESIRLYESAVKFSEGRLLPGPPGEAYSKLADAYWQQQDISKSVKYYQIATEQNPIQSYWLCQLGNGQYEQEQYKQAKESFRSSLLLMDKKEELLINDMTYKLAFSEFHDKCFPEAIELFESYLSKNNPKENLECIYKLAKSYQEIDKLDESEEHFKQYIQYKEDSVDAYLDLAQIYQKRENYNEAIKTYEKADQYLPVIEQEKQHEQNAEGVDDAQTENSKHKGPPSSRKGSRQGSRGGSRGQMRLGSREIPQQQNSLEPI